MNALQSKFTVSQRRACRVVDQPRQTQRYQVRVRDDEPALIKQILELVREFPRYVYRLIWAKLRQLGWKINKKRVHRIWKQEGLKVPVKKPKKRRLGDSNNSSQRRRAESANEVWCWDFIFDRTPAGKQLKWLVIVDEFTRENLCLDVGYNFTSEDVIDRLASLAKTRGMPKFIRSDNGPELIAEKLRVWLRDLDVGTLYIAPGSPWENAYAESFNSRFRDEFLAMEVFDNLAAARKLSIAWQANYNHCPSPQFSWLPDPGRIRPAVFPFGRYAPFREHCRETR